MRESKREVSRLHSSITDMEPLLSRADKLLLELEQAGARSDGAVAPQGGVKDEPMGSSVSNGEAQLARPIRLLYA